MQAVCLLSTWALNGGILLAREKPVSKVVKMLKDMLDKSKTEGDEEQKLYGKFKCYCDDNEKEKKKSIRDLNKELGLLKNDIEALQGSNGELSLQVAKLKADITENEMTTKEAKAVREDEAKAYEKTEKDLKEAIDQLGKAIDVLSAIGADQNLQSNAEHEKFMAGYGKEESLLKLKTSVNQALLAASSVLRPAERSRIEFFLQAPFTGSYTSASGEIMGILKQMQETFESNLEAAKSAESRAKDSHEKLLKTKEDELKTLNAASDKKQELMGGNDGDLTDKKTAREAATKQLAEDEDFLELLLPKCTKKADEYEKRKLMRANEEAAIAKAIAILDSDLAFKAFSKTDATSTGSTGFLQITQHPSHKSEKNLFSQAAHQLMQTSSHVGGSSKLRRVAALLQAGNPFETVLAEIEEMKKVIEKEGKLDQEKKTWCEDERKSNKENLDKKKDQIKTLKGEITTLEDAIDNPETGIKKLIEDDEKSLVENAKTQKDSTKQRREENKLYQKDIAELAQAQKLLKRAIKVLKDYYEAEDKAAEALMEEEPATPDTWKGDYKGQSSKGNEVITMLEFILKESEKEETTEHDTEKDSQKSYEDEMKKLKDSEKDLQSSLVDLKKSLAEKESDLESNRVDLEETEREQKSIERYLEKIKPGCDFITDNFDTRESNREEETKALDKATQLLKDSPAYKAAAAKASK